MNLISTFSKVSVPVQNWAVVAERWRRRRRRRWRRWCCGKLPPTWGESRGSRASSPLMMGDPPITLWNQRSSRSSRLMSEHSRAAFFANDLGKERKKRAMIKKKMCRRSNYPRLRPVIFNNNAIDHKATILFSLQPSLITTKEKCDRTPRVKWFYLLSNASK